MPVSDSTSNPVLKRGQRGRGRPAQSPCSILDRKALLAALDSKDIAFKPEHIDGLYQALHRQHYPSLPEFVDQYYENERTVMMNRHQQDRGNGLNGATTSKPEKQTQQPVMPLKNPVSNFKNRNRKNLPKPFLQFLADPNNGFVTITSKVAKVMTSEDGSTTKLAVELHDGQLVESVLMRYGPKVDGKVIQKCGRASLCVSSQVGCAMACSFCATGMMGLTGDLSYSEILEQMIHANRILASEALERRTLQESATVEEGNNGKKKKKNNNRDLDVVRNVVFMGMGEPLDNYSNVVEACRAMIDRKRWNLAHGRVTVSTVGIASKIRKLTKELPEVSLALSLHAPNQRLRSKIVPTAKNYPIEDMIEALDGHMMAYLKERPNDANTKHRADTAAQERITESSRRRAMIEYVMLEGETSSFQCAHELGKLCENKSLVVNLIPYNATDVKDKLRCPSDEHIKQFRRIVFSYGVFTTIRRTMGADIASACGQLVVKEEENKLRDIEDGLAGGTNTGKSKTVAGQTRSARMKPGIQATPAEDTIVTQKQDTKTVKDEAADLERLIRPLQIATTIAASCFLLTTTLYLRRKKQ